MDKRPDPDKLLKNIQAEDSKKGKLKIFFGAVAGVGKTYTMLEQARARKREGVDVAIGLVETHKRPETEALLEGLEIIPLKSITYRNIEVEEFDLEAALKRRPALILVDELAHSNAPGSRHAKRWQDVEELLDAGINVYTTLNVQHCESVNDIVAQITKVIVRETVPDTFVEKADEIELVDIPTEELLKRLREGKVYLGEQAQLAVRNFFRFGNLIALRQLALKYTTRSVDTKLRLYKDVHEIPTVWKVGEQFLVCISSNPGATKIIRAARQIASDLGAQWTVVHVEGPSAFEQSDEDKRRAAEMLRFAEKMGANTVTLSGDDVAETLISYAQSKNISRIIIGKPGKPSLKEILFGSFIDKLTRKCGDIDLYLISGESAEESPKAEYVPVKANSFAWKGVLWAVFIIALCTAVNKLLFSYLALANLIMIYLLGVTWLAFRYGRYISIIGTFLSIACFDFFFIPPFYTFSVMDRGHFITFSVMLLVGLIIGNMTGRLRRQTIGLRLREERTQVLYSLSRDLAKSSRPDELFQILLSHIQDFFKCPGVIFIAGSANKTPSVLTAVSGGRDLAVKEQAVAGWVQEHRKIAGKGTDTFSGSEGLYVPLIGSQEVVGVLGVFPSDEKQFLSPDNFHILEMFVSQTAMAVEGALLAEANTRAELELGKARIRNMILDTAAYDVKGSLDMISKAASELLKREIVSDETKRNSLIKEIIGQVEQLDNLAVEFPKIIDELKQS
ncbi:MAG: sensor histidine kinase KdpD [Sedimentisphaerales bacterium]